MAVSSVGLHEQHAELVAAEASHDIGVAHAVDEDLGDMLQRGVARGWPWASLICLRPLTRK